jgi:hypothetical protein
MLITLHRYTHGDNLTTSNPAQKQNPYDDKKILFVWKEQQDLFLISKVVMLVEPVTAGVDGSTT